MAAKGEMYLAILETMWDWRAMTSEAGYARAPAFFSINPDNFSGRRLYRLLGDRLNTWLQVTNACPELVSGPNQHGKQLPHPAARIWTTDALGRASRLIEGCQRHIGLTMERGRLVARELPPRCRSCGMKGYGHPPGVCRSCFILGKTG